MTQRNKHIEPGGINRRDGLIAIMGAVAALSGCGGGSDIASVGSGGTGSFTSGMITGFGSIIVNGIRFDDSQATIKDDDGVAHTPDDLKLGMIVSITASPVTTTATGSTATASSITFGSELRGAIQSIGTQDIVVLGQTVQITSTTFFDSSFAGGPAGLAVGQIVDVHGFVDAAANQIVATRIDLEAAVQAPPVNKLEGQVQSLDTVAKTFAIGAVTISYAGLPAAAIPGNLANGLVVRVELAPTPATGTRNAVSMQSPDVKVQDQQQVQLNGAVNAFTSTAKFSVNGVAVDASKAAFPNGSAQLKVGARVEVQGTSSNGVLVASSVKVDTPSEVSNQQIELHGAISNLNAARKTFVVRGVTVSYAGTVKFDGGDVSKLASIASTSATVEVKGTYDAATNSVSASQISFED